MIHSFDFDQIVHLARRIARTEIQIDKLIARKEIAVDSLILLDIRNSLMDDMVALENLREHLTPDCNKDL